MSKLAWKFLRPDHCLNYADKRELVAGATLREPRDANGVVVTEPILCGQGFHASVNARDALRFANGMTHIARVEIGGLVAEGPDKIAGTEIHCLWIADAEKTLRLFAIACRWRQMGYQLRGREPSLAALWALDCAERFVRGEADEDERQAAYAAAYAAYAADAAYAAAYASADASADAADAADAAYAAAYASADASAYAADAAAAAYAAYAAERLTANEDLESALEALHG